MLRCRWWLAAALFLSGSLRPHAQSPALDQLVPRLVANGQRYSAALPSLTCDETITSQLLKGGTLKEQVVLHATLQVRRRADAVQPFVEAHEWKTRDGAVVPPGKPVKAPYIVTGAFINGLGFSSLEHIACYDLVLRPATGASQPLELLMTAKPGTESQAACQNIAPGASRRVLVEATGGHVTHLERTIPPAESERRKEVFFAAIDYGPVQLGAETFWLPTHTEMHDSGGTRRMLASYTGCHRFTGTVTILDGISTVPE